MNRSQQLKSDMQRYGEKLVRYGLAHSQVGNLSVRAGDTILITRHGCQLDELSHDQIVELSIREPLHSDSNASSDAVIHLALYATTKAGAIIHAHSPYAVAESILTPEGLIVTEDIETRYLLREIPLIPAATDPLDTADSCAKALHSYPAIIVRAHGTIAVGSDLKEAYLHVSSVEHACRVRNLCRVRR